MSVAGAASACEYVFAALYLPEDSHSFASIDYAHIAQPHRVVVHQDSQRL
jgi:hypothetical protein